MSTNPKKFAQWHKQSSDKLWDFKTNIPHMAQRSINMSPRNAANGHVRRVFNGPTAS
ncbi:hypothetical protein [Parasphingorhabdus sp.]|uniref:hypothetical protein n=1 Tax=Parasphingorhabdus sp. TaxID=2709688 RepID=UPI00137289B6